MHAGTASRRAVSVRIESPHDLSAQGRLLPDDASNRDIRFWPTAPLKHIRLCETDSAVTNQIIEIKVQPR